VTNTGSIGRSRQLPPFESCCCPVLGGGFMLTIRFRSRRQHLFLRQGHAVQEGLHRRLPVASGSWRGRCSCRRRAMCRDPPGTRETRVELRPERHPELVQHRLVEPLADPVRLQVFTFVRVWSMFSIARYSSYSCRSGAPQYFGLTIGEHAARRNAVRLEERDDAIVQEIGRRQCVFASYSSRSRGRRASP